MTCEAVSDSRLLLTYSCPAFDSLIPLSSHHDYQIGKGKGQTGPGSMPDFPDGATERRRQQILCGL